MIPITALRSAFEAAKMNRRSTRSTITPIGIAKSNQGNITIAPITEIKTVLSVRVIASSGAAAIRTPSARLETKLLAHKRLNAGPIVGTVSGGFKRRFRLPRNTHDEQLIPRGLRTARSSDRAMSGRLRFQYSGRWLH